MQTFTLLTEKQMFYLKTYCFMRAIARHIVTVGRLKAFGSQNTLSTDLCSFKNDTTYLFPGRDSMVPEKSRMSLCCV